MPRWSDREIDRLAELAALGRSAGQIGLLLGRSEGAVRSVARMHGISLHGKPGRKPGGVGSRKSAPGTERREPGMWTPMEDLALRECAASGWGFEDTSMELGIRPEDVAAEAARLGIEING